MQGGNESMWTRCCSTRLIVLGLRETCPAVSWMSCSFVCVCVLACVFVCVWWDADAAGFPLPRLWWFGDREGGNEADPQVRWTFLRGRRSLRHTDFLREVDAPPVGVDVDVEIEVKIWYVVVAFLVSCSGTR